MRDTEIEGVRVFEFKDKVQRFGLRRAFVDTFLLGEVVEIDGKLHHTCLPYKEIDITAVPPNFDLAKPLPTIEESMERLQTRGFDLPEDQLGAIALTDVMGQQRRRNNAIMVAVVTGKL